MKDNESHNIKLNETKVRERERERGIAPISIPSTVVFVVSRQCFCVVFSFFGFKSEKERKKNKWKIEKTK